jgi:hypothetical protein
MTKLDLQQELLEKVKPGTKPSDIKRQVKKSLDEGYESDRSDKSIPTAPPLPNQNLLNQIKALQRQLQVYQDFKEADLKIKEKYKQEIKNLQAKIQAKDKTISDLQNQAKPTTKATPTQGTQTEPTSFYCDICQQTKPGSYIIRKLDSPFSPRTHQKLCYLCSTCRKYTKEYNEKAN